MAQKRSKRYLAAQKKLPDAGAKYSIPDAVAILPQAPATWIAAGGGARNPTLIRMLGEALGPAVVVTANEVGWSADALEAQAFAFLAVRSLQGLPLTFPTTTGVPRAMTGGVVATPEAD